MSSFTSRVGRGLGRRDEVAELDRPGRGASPMSDRGSTSFVGSSWQQRSEWVSVYVVVGFGRAVSVGFGLPTY